MSNVSKQTGTIITVVTAILFGCASLLMCINSVVVLRVARLELIGRGAPLLFAGQLVGPIAGCASLSRCCPFP